MIDIIVTTAVLLFACALLGSRITGKPTPLLYRDDKPWLGVSWGERPQKLKANSGWHLGRWAALLAIVVAIDYFW